VACRRAQAEIVLGVAGIVEVVLAAVDLCVNQTKTDINVFASKKLKTQLLLPGRRWKSAVALLSTPPGKG
jgi:ATP phosphoribosyltransferase regulatory subunit HisZ